MKRAIIIFTRIPKAGQTKTRMMPYLTPEECCRLHTCFLQDIAGTLKKCKGDLFVFYTPEPSCGELEKIFGTQVTYLPQKGEDLGRRMYHAIETVLEKGYSSCVLLGTDVPELTHGDIEEAFQVLSTQDMVFGPTEDGGYYLIGMKRPIKEAFQITTYGHGSVLEETLEQLKKGGFSVGLSHKHQDMDTKEDLLEFIKRAREDKTLTKSHTGEFIKRIPKISIIIPTYNEKLTILSLQKQLDIIKDRCEIIFVDGGSTDGTMDLIDTHYKVLQGVKGRANQMNYGAKESRGDILFFLHCDSILPTNPLEEIYEVMAKHSWGCFGVGFHATNFFMLTNRVISNHRAKYRRIVFGDQGIFIERELFFKVGMFPALPIMEDYQLSLTLREMNIKPGMAKHRIYTSPRRYPKGTIPKLKVMWKMFRLRKRYRDGESIQQISDEYKDIR